MKIPANVRLGLALAALATGAFGLAGCNGGTTPPQPESEAPEPATRSADATGSDAPRAVRSVSQEPGRIVYWVLPGPRVLSESVFGTPENPKMLLEPKLEAAERAKMFLCWLAFPSRRARCRTVNGSLPSPIRSATEPASFRGISQPPSRIT